MATIIPLSLNPLSFTGCSLWLDGSDSLTVIRSGNVVTQWNDKSGNNRNLTATSGTVTYANNRLTFPSVGIMTGPSMNFSGSIFLVVRPTAQSGGSAGFNMIIGRAGNDPSIRFDSNYQLRNPGDGNDIGNGAAYVINGTQITVTNPALNTQNNIIYTPINSSFTATFSVSNTYLARYFIGEIFEIIMYTTARTTFQRQQIEGYLAWKWGLVGSLPANHPYKLVAPNVEGLAYPSSVPIPVPTQTLQTTSFPIVFFNPTSIPGCQLWLDAADTSTLTFSSGSNVSQWNDKSGNGRNTAAVYGTPQRSFNGGFGSLPSIFFGANSAFSGPIANTGTTLTTFIVGRINTAGVGRRFLSLGQPGRFDFGTTTDIVALTTGNLTSEFGWYRNGSAFVTTVYNTPFIYTLNVNGSTGVIVYNGSTTSSGNTSGSFGYTTYGVAVGFGTSGISQYLTDGFIAEVLVYNSSFSQGQRQQVEGYLAWKWGLQGLLPLNHPFKNAVPGPLNIAISNTSMQPVSFSPTQISGCQLWLDAADASTLTLIGSNVSQWNDKSGNGKNVSQANISQQGTYIQTNQNGLSVLSLSSNQGGYSGSSITVNGLSNMSIFAVVNNTTNQNITQGGLGIIYWAEIGSWGQVYLQAYQTKAAWRFGTGAVNNAPSVTFSPSVGTNYNVLMVSKTGSTEQVYQNGNIIANTTGNGTTISATGNPFIVGSVELTNNIGEIIVYTTSLTTSERQSLEGYLAWKWGLQGNLPANHPFKKFQPPPN